MRPALPHAGTLPAPGRVVSPASGTLAEGQLNGGLVVVDVPTTTVTANIRPCNSVPGRGFVTSRPSSGNSAMPIDLATVVASMSIAPLEAGACLRNVPVHALSQRNEGARQLA